MSMQVQTASAAPAWQERRRVLRHSLVLPAMLRARDVGAFRVTLRDLSAAGCRIETPLPLRADTFVLLTLPGFAPLDATCVWAVEGAAGLEFAQPLHPAVLDHVVALGNPKLLD